MKPKVFIGSSREGVHIADAVHANLTYETECTVWKDGVFQLSQNTLVDLVRVLRNSDFGIFIFSPDDVSIMRGNESSIVRDNVLFELGLFIGRLGPERCFFLIPDSASNLRLPSDLAGVTPGRYEGSRSDGNWIAALNPACLQIKMQIARLKSFQDTTTPFGEKGSTQKSEIPISAEGKIYLEEYKESFLVKGNTKPHKDEIKAFANWNSSLVAWVLPRKKHDEFINAFQKYM